MKNCVQRSGVALLILACAIAASGAQPPLELADDLSAVAKLSRQKTAPIMLVFTRADCPYCARAKQHHLEALAARQSHGAGVIIREIEAGGSRLALRDFEGKATTHGELARRYAVRSVPTVIVVDPHGKPLSEAIIGLLSPDFYDLYLERAIDEGRTLLRARGQQH